ncbi:MAG: hypothetical protein ACW99J_17630 [Candidatus Thorarchaeota archaeon]|jgi:hypothetical protein
MGNENQPQVTGALRRLHYGPGPHPGTGTDQDVHGEGNGGYETASGVEFEDGKLPLIGTKAAVLTSTLLTYFRSGGQEWVNVEVVEVDSLAEEGGWVTVEILSGPNVGEQDEVSIDEWIKYAADYDEGIALSDDPEERAVEMFGLTENMFEAGYLMADGSMLDFSGKNQGGQSGVRNFDHRDIWQAFPDDYEFPQEEDEGSNWRAMVEFMRLGNIRMSVFGSYLERDVSLDIAKLPTSAQKRVMRDTVVGATYLSWDITDPETGNILASGRGDYPDARELAVLFESAVRKLVGRSFEFRYFTLRITGEQPSHRIDAREIDYGWAGKFKDEGVFTTPIEPTDGIIALPKAARGLSMEEEVEPVDEIEEVEKKSLIDDIKRSFTELMAAIRRER